jgi:hypothetical protein
MAMEAREMPTIYDWDFWAWQAAVSVVMFAVGYIFGRQTKSRASGDVGD